MTSYIPESVFGHIPGTYPPQYGLLPWPPHMRSLPTKLWSEKRRQRAIAAEVAQIVDQRPDHVRGDLTRTNGVFWLTFDINDRPSFETTIERLINMLDDLDDDPDLEPDLGAGDDREGDYAHLAYGGTSDDEPHSDDEPDSDDEDSGDREPSLGRLETMHQGIATYGGDDDREGDDEREADPAEDGIADTDAYYAEDLFPIGWQQPVFTGGGNRMAKALLLKHATRPRA